MPSIAPARPASISLLAALILLTSLFAAPADVYAQSDQPNSPFESFTKAWQTDPTWFDGQAEDATYEAVRIMHSRERAYEATIYTNAEHASAESKTKADDGKGRPVFKLHLREDVPAENYNYHYSTMCYVGRPDLKSLKIDFGSLEDCGASFKQVINHAGELTWQQFSYHPNQGHREGEYAPPADIAYFNALPLILRGYPFDEPRDIVFKLLPDQISSKWTASEPTPAVISYVGRETLGLPIGKVDAHHLRVTWGARHEVADFWFHADGGAPLLHVMVQYKRSDGMQYQLKKHRRWAYWDSSAR